jgi:GntR family transcriptional regulator
LFDERAITVLLQQYTVFFLDANSGVPLYVQLHQQIRQRISSGQLEHGEQLPSVRDLSSELHVNPLTVAKVYQLLERDGFVETRRGIGTYVAPRPPVLRMDARRQQLGPAVEQLVAEATHLGLGQDEIQALISERFQKLNRKAQIP